MLWFRVSDLWLGSLVDTHADARTHARSYFGCSFKIQKQKETTGRVVVWREFNVLNRYRPSGPQ